MNKKIVAYAALVILFLSSCSIQRGGNLVERIRNGYYPYKVQQYVRPGYTQYGTASWYGNKFHGRRTADGEIYNMYAKTAANKTLPFNTYVKVINLNNHRETVVRINDRGPFVKNRIIDLSYAAAKDLGMIGTGTAPVKIIVLSSNRPYNSNMNINNGSVPNSTDSNNGYKNSSRQDSFIYSIQIGSFRFLSNAIKFRDRAAKTVGDIRIEKAVISGNIFYRVVVGSFISRRSAVDYANENIAPIFGNFCIIYK